METVRAKYDPGLISYSRFQYTQGYSEAQLLYSLFFKSQHSKTSWVLQFCGFTVSQRDIISTKGVLILHLCKSPIFSGNLQELSFFKNFKLTSQVRVYFMAIFRHW